MMTYLEPIYWTFYEITAADYKCVVYGSPLTSYSRKTQKLQIMQQ